jgi:hypothetical protein
VNTGSKSVGTSMPPTEHLTSLFPFKGPKIKVLKLWQT